jgi:intracellular septation protein A
MQKGTRLVSTGTHAQAELPADAPEGGAPVDLELPRPWRLALTVSWNLAESIGLPVAAYLAGLILKGQVAGMVASTVVVWLAVAVRAATTRRVPGLLLISALVVAVQTAVVVPTGSTLFFLLQFPLANLAMCALFARSAATSKPLVAQLAQEVAGLRQSSREPGLDRFFAEVTWLWAGIFAASAALLAVAMIAVPADAALV